MKISKKWSALVEATMTILIITTGIIWVFTIYNNSVKLSATTENRILATQVAREWIEALMNIRDTNWLNFAADLEKCWNTMNYNTNCVWAINDDTDIQTGTWYMVYRDANDRWLLDQITGASDWGQDYIDDFRVWYDDNWFFTQTWATINYFAPIMTREIIISYPDDPDKMKVESIVKWVDSAKVGYHEIKFETTLTNWKK